MAAVPPPAAVVIGPGRVGRCIAQFYKPPAPLIGRQQQLPGNLTVSEYDYTTLLEHHQAVTSHNGCIVCWMGSLSSHSVPWAVCSAQMQENIGFFPITTSQPQQLHDTPTTSTALLDLPAHAFGLLLLCKQRKPRLPFHFHLHLYTLPFDPAV
mgnify:CR=1 FL=1